MNKALNKISDVKNAIENLAENYHCKFDYLNEKAQQGERAQAMAEECMTISGGRIEPAFAYLFLKEDYHGC